MCVNIASGITNKCVGNLMKMLFFYLHSTAKRLRKFDLRKLIIYKRCLIYDLMAALADDKPIT